MASWLSFPLISTIRSRTSRCRSLGFLESPLQRDLQRAVAPDLPCEGVLFAEDFAEKHLHFDHRLFRLCVVSTAGGDQGQTVHALADFEMFGIDRSKDRDRLPVEGFRLFEPPLIDVEERGQLQSLAEHRVIRPECLAANFQRALVERLCLLRLASTAEEDGEVRVAGAEVRVVGAEPFRENGLRVPIRLFGFVEPVDLVEENAEVAQVRGGQGVVVAEHPTVCLVDAALVLLGPLGSPFQKRTCP